MTTFVLIPGAGGVAWYWHRVVPLLRAAGPEAIAIELPGDDPESGPAQYAQIIRAAIKSEDVVLVAMSLGGFTAPLVAGDGVTVRGIVFVNAMIPRPGEAAGDWWENTGAAQARIQTAKERGYSTEFDLDTYFLHDVPSEVIAAGEPHQRPEADIAFAATCDFAAWPAIPLRVVAGNDDRFFPVEFQQRVARERIGVNADILPGGHLMALSQPEPLARYLLNA